MPDNLDKLVAMLAESGTVATREQAERLAVRVAGSVDAYIQRSEQFRDRVAGYQAQPQPAGGVSKKFSDPVAYRIVPDGSARSSQLSGAADQDADR
jgi:hypothetical protein